MTSINTNAGALNARASALQATANMEPGHGAPFIRIRVNSAADDAAGLLSLAKWKPNCGALICLFGMLRMVLA